MRDPLNWALPLPVRPFGITVKIHVLFFVITLGLFFRQIGMKDNPVWWFDVFAFTVLLLFGLILLHEYGHCFGCRAVGGEANEILLWPLGGLAFVDPPHTPRANFITTAAGPGVNLAVCAILGLGMVAAGFWPNANPLTNPYVTELKNFRDGRVYTSVYGLKLYKAGTAEPAQPPPAAATDVLKELLKDKDEPREKITDMFEKLAAASAGQGVERALAPTWVVWFQRAFQMSWVLFLFNMLLPAFPMDCGRLLQAAIWARTGSYRQGTTVACYSGFVVGLLLLVVSISYNETLLAMLGIYIFYSCIQQMHQMDQEEGAFGYDFSQGYTSLERDDPPAAKPKQPGALKRWLAARQARRTQREQQERARDEERMDQLLEKIARQGKAALTDEERRFMERVSARYRNRS